MASNFDNLAQNVLSSSTAKNVINTGLNSSGEDVYLHDPNEPAWGAKYKLAPLEEKSLDPDWASKNPELATLNYPGFSESSRAHRYNEGPGSIFRNFVQPYVLNPLSKGLGYTTQFGPVGSALATGGVGYASGKLIDRLLGNAGINSRFDILLGLLGAGGGYALSNLNKNAKTLRMKKNSSFYKLGQAIGFAANGVPVSTGAVLVSKEDTLKNVSTPGYGVMQKNVCKLAADMYAFTNQQDKLEYHIFNKMAHAQHWSETLDPYVDAVYETLTNLNTKNDFDINGVVKSSSAILNLFTGLAARGAVASPDAIKALLGLSAVTGGSLGVATWLANRHAQEDATKNEELKQKLNYYNMVTDELSNQLKSKGLIVSEEDPEAKDKQLV